MDPLLLTCDMDDESALDNDLGCTPLCSETPTKADSGGEKASSKMSCEVCQVMRVL